MATAHVVTSPLVISKKEDGSDLYLYEGAVLPDHVSADETKRLVDLGLISKPEDAAKASKSKPSSESN